MQESKLWLVWLGVGVIGVLIIAAIVRFFLKYAAELRNVRAKIDSAKGWEEYVHWKHALRRLYCSILPGLTPCRVRKIAEFFARPKREKKKENDGLFSMLAPSVLGFVVCCVCLFSATFAWFTDGIETQGNTLTAANFDISAQVTAICSGDAVTQNADGTYPLVGGTAYTVKLTASGTASTGFGRIRCQSDPSLDYATKQLWNDGQGSPNAVTFKLYAESGGDYAFSGVWGTYSGTGIEDDDLVGTPHKGVLNPEYALNDAENPYSVTDGGITFDVRNYDSTTVSDLDLHFAVILNGTQLENTYTIAKDAHKATVSIPNLAPGVYKVEIKSLSCLYCAATNGCNCNKSTCICNEKCICDDVITLYFKVEAPFYTVSIFDGWVEVDVYTLSSGKDIAVEYNGCFADPTDPQMSGWEDGLGGIGGSGTLSVEPYTHYSLIFLNADEDNITFKFTQNGVELEEKEP